MSAPEYAELDGRRVQVLDRRETRPDCRVCGGDGYVESGACENCAGTGKEVDRVVFARVGLLDGDERGRTREVRASALVALDACPTCGEIAARFTGHIAAPGYGVGGECRSCGAKLWSAGSCGGRSSWIDYRDMDGPPELSIDDVR